MYNVYMNTLSKFLNYCDEINLEKGVLDVKCNSEKFIVLDKYILKRRRIYVIYVNCKSLKEF